jgi:hypothetical protein
MRSSMVKVASVAALAATAALGVAGTANAATTPREHTTLSIVESKTSIFPGGKDTISGQLKADGKDAAGKAILLFRFVDGKAHLLQAHVTGKLGNVSFVVKPAHTTKYELVFLGNSKLDPTHSGIVTTVVK